MTISLNELAAKHFDWVERMGWHNKTVLEALALICSEVGEVAIESFMRPLPENFGEELADIVLRSLDLAWSLNIDIDQAMVQYGFATPQARNAALAWKAKTPAEEVAELMVELKGCINAARKSPLEEDFMMYLIRLIARVQSMAYRNEVILLAQITHKMNANERNGTRGRRI